MTGLECLGKPSVHRGIENNAAEKRIPLANAEYYKIFTAFHIALFRMYTVVGTKVDAYNVARAQFFDPHVSLLFKNGAECFILCNIF